MECEVRFFGAVSSATNSVEAARVRFDGTSVQDLLDHIQKEQSENINGSAITLLSMMKQYGFASLEEANERLKSHS